MTLPFGAVASMYDDVRPGYPPAILPAITDYHGGVPASVAELGAGTGKATELLVRLKAGEQRDPDDGREVPVIAVEPDPRMSAVLRAKFPAVNVVTSTFEAWSPPPGGVELIACGLAWHWLAPDTRNRLALDALSPGGTLAVFAHQYRFAAPAAERRIEAAMLAVGDVDAKRSDHWIFDDIAGSGLFADVTEQVFHSAAEFTTERYLKLTRTFSPFRRRPPEQQSAYLAALRQALDDLGGAVTLELETALILARRPGRARWRSSAGTARSYGVNDDKEAAHAAER
jgi:SAM-dependent methyltransferase